MLGTGEDGDELKKTKKQEEDENRMEWKQGKVGFGDRDGIEEGEGEWKAR